MASTSRVTLNRATDTPDLAPAEDAQAPTSSRRPTMEEIAAEAYAIYMAQGALDGNDLDHWLEAERRIADARPSSGMKDSADLQQSDHHRQHDATDAGQRLDRNTIL